MNAQTHAIVTSIQICMCIYIYTYACVCIYIVRGFARYLCMYLYIYTYTCMQCVCIMFGLVRYCSLCFFLSHIVLYDFV